MINEFMEEDGLSVSWDCKEGAAREEPGRKFLIRVKES